MQKLIPLVCLILAGCGSTQQVDKINIAHPPAALTAACAPLIDVTARTSSQVETQWKLDRISLAECAKLHAEATAWYANRDEGLVNGTPK